MWNRAQWLKLVVTLSGKQAQAESSRAQEWHKGNRPKTR